MDPNANLRMQAESDDPRELRKLRQSLVDWMGRNGFLPAWNTEPATARDFLSWCRRYRPDVWHFRKLMDVDAQFRREQ